MFNLKVRNNSTGTHGLHEGKERDYGEIVADIDFPTFQDVLSFVRECQELAELRISDELYTYRFHDITDYGILLVVDSKY